VFNAFDVFQARHIRGSRLRGTRPPGRRFGQAHGDRRRAARRDARLPRKALLRADTHDRLPGGAAQAQITVLRPGSKLRYRVVGQGPVTKLAPYFGTSVQFALDRAIPVNKGYVIALTTPTWIPALAVNLPTDTSWRASRAKGTCDETSKQTAQSGMNSLAQYYCLYRGARLTYSATFIPDPVAPK
jgi:hypothetical protein